MTDPPPIVRELSPIVRRKAEQLGEAGQRWLAGLPSVVAELERRRSVTVTAPLSGGSAAYVARVRRADGGDAVLKVGVSAEDTDQVIATLCRPEENAAHGSPPACICWTSEPRNSPARS